MAATDPGAGYMLLDMTLALAVLLVVALVLWPSILGRTTRPQLAALALDSAATLRSLRVEAVRRGEPASARLDLATRQLHGDGGRAVTFPADLAVDFVTDRRCRPGARLFVLTFAPDGSSCGGVLTLSTRRAAWRIEINWLTGAIDARETGRR